MQVRIHRVFNKPGPDPDPEILNPTGCTGEQLSSGSKCRGSHCLECTLYGIILFIPHSHRYTQLHAQSRFEYCFHSAPSIIVERRMFIYIGPLYEISTKESQYLVMDLFSIIFLIIKKAVG
jgi:hypothetical protein